MLLYSYYQQLVADLRQYYEASEASAVALFFIENFLKVTRTDIFAQKEIVLSMAESTALQAKEAQLRSGMPVQYVLETTEFGECSFHVSPAVLIPRPETLGLVEWACECSSSTEKHILDCGTGSGCLAISLARLFPKAVVEACDLSPDALSVAQKNAARLQAAVKFHCCDLLQMAQNLLAATILPPHFKPNDYDLLISNPPYIPQAEACTMERHVLAYEPSLALFVPTDDPLCFYRALAILGKHLLKEQGVLLVETHRDYNTDVGKLFGQMGYTAIEYRLDCFDNPRFVKAIK